MQILLNSDLKNDSASALSSNEVSSLKKQLRNIRDQVNKLLDSIDSTDSKYGGSSHAGMMCKIMFIHGFILFFFVLEDIFIYINDMNKYVCLKILIHRVLDKELIR